MLRIVFSATVGILIAVGAAYRYYNNRQQLREFNEVPVQPFSSAKRESCPICLKPMNEKTAFLMTCSHQLHKCCAKILFIEQRMKSCPVCRKVQNIDFKRQLK